jgi:hypothetical protein
MNPNAEETLELVLEVTGYVPAWSVSKPGHSVPPPAPIGANRLDSGLVQVEYAKWQPYGVITEDGSMPEGSYLVVKAELRAKPGGTPPSASDWTIVLRLNECSKEPGVCINWPAQTKTSLTTTSLDMGWSNRLDAHLNVWQSNTPGHEATAVKENGIEATGVIQCFDFGACAILTAVASPKLGFGGGMGIPPHGGSFPVNQSPAKHAPVVGHLKGEPQTTEILLPKRRPASKIADEWKKQVGLDLDVRDLDDFEGLPATGAVADVDAAGDGFTLYEEYRGAVIGGEWRRLVDANNKGKRKLYLSISPSVRNHKFFPHAQAGIQKFQELTNMVLVTNLLETEYNDQRILNFNSGDDMSVHLPRGFFEQGQGIIRVRNAGLKGRRGAKSVGRAETSNNEPSTPGYVLWLTLDFGAWQNDLNENVRIVVHELGHCVNIPHHSTTQAAASEEHFIDLWETLIAVPQGNFSGNYLCPMRYRGASAYRYGPEVGDQIRFFVWSTAENKLERTERPVNLPFNLTGDTNELGSFCDAPTGTGRNAGGAAAGDGGTKGCQHYIRVRDLPGVRPG